MTQSPAPLGTVHLGIDVGTSNTAAAVRGRDHEVRPVLFDGALLLPSAVLVDGDTALVGLDARHAGIARPALLEPNPKRCIDDRIVLLGEQEIPVESLLAAILRRVRDAAEQTTGPVDAVTLTYPATWGPRRLATLTAAARLAGLPAPTTVHEPVSAAAHFVGLPDVELPEGQLALVYDLGAGTFDATLIRRTGNGFEVVASQGLPDAGGLDIDAAIVASVSAHLRPDDEAWRYLRQPQTPADLRHRQLLTDGVRTAKEMLSRTSATSVYVPVLDVEVPLGREQFERLARPLLDRTVAATRAVLRDADVAEAELSAIFLVGGSTRIPLVGTLLHRALGRPPVVLDQPELAVAYGSVVGSDLLVRSPGALTRVLPAEPPTPATDPLPVDRATGATTLPLPVDAATGAAPTAPPGRGGSGTLPLPAGQPVPAASAVPADATDPTSTASVTRQSFQRAGRWLGRHRRWTAAALGLVLVALAGFVYAAADGPGGNPGAGPTATSTSRPPAGGGSASAAPVAASSPSPTPRRGVPAPFVGRWTGRVSQPTGVVKSWGLAITLATGSDVGRFVIGSLRCEGTLTVVAPAPTERELHLRARTTRDPQSKCVDAGDYTLIISGRNRLDMFWQQFGDPTNVATATLTRS
ncbi:Hsp70 family protein [Plantactinospora endophytica]|uniref:Hsp70 family protein n=1 Tax=Plantactinospora endophytica TaxID=673535 RepID=A0ABQ4E2S3_9ACTN|nr:Hsp70 family protein [Plantactinospora endophytica]GIG89004.1 hypothetical protein Pen02_39400 [Plantactinospora endophytica]